MKHRFISIVGIVCLVIGTFGAGFLVGHSQQSPAAAQGISRDEAFAPVMQAWDYLHEYYVDPLSDDELVDGMLTGLMDAVGDPHTDYMNLSRYATAQEDLAGSYEGIGASVRPDPDTGILTIVRPFPDSPAERAGLLPGDQIITVDGQNVVGLEQEEIILLVKGPAGTDVVLGIQREGEPELLNITVTRGRIELPSLEYEVLENDILYVLLYDFSQDADEELAALLIEQDVENMNGLILDLRGNTGGYLDTTLSIISMFIEEGPIFIQRGRDGEEEIINAYGNPIAPTVPMVILVDGFSASASELTTGALQDYGRATIIGTQTYGKGSVQTWRELVNGGGIRITIARWFTPADRSVEPDGLTPDIELEYIAPDPDQPYVRAEDNQIQFAIEYLLEEAQRVPSGPVAAAKTSMAIRLS
ncbi:MAG: hypothetical protein CUN55_12855 [Phototrophicales bacterium]|nr:MAG: hypothetical protein CUN55_12855 [Phototrophicales bacterium]